MKKPWPCRFGFHNFFNDSTMINLGSEEKPVYFVTTKQKCNYCSYSSKG